MLIRSEEKIKKLNKPITNIGFLPAFVLNEKLNLDGKNLTAFDYDTEILLMTNSKLGNFYNLIAWIFYHKLILNVSQITIVHNNCNDEESKDILKNICTYFNINYYYEDCGEQTYIFNKYQKKSKAKWLICIDEDEYIYITNNNYKLSDLLKLYRTEHKVSLPMINFFSKELLPETDIKKPFPLIYNYADIYKKSLIDESKIIESKIFFKTFVNNSYFHYIFNTKSNDYVFLKLDEELFTFNNEFSNNTTCVNISTVHNPLCIDNKRVIPSRYINEPRYYYHEGAGLDLITNITYDNIKAFIAHFKYRSLAEYMNKIKYNKFDDVTDGYYKSYENSLIYTVYENNNFVEYNKLKFVFTGIEKDINSICELFLK